jgi:hypothetical protein
LKKKNSIETKDKEREERHKVVGPLKTSNTKTATQNEIINMAKGMEKEQPKPIVASENTSSSSTSTKKVETSSSSTTDKKAKVETSSSTKKEAPITKDIVPQDIINKVNSQGGAKGDGDWDMIKEYRAEKCVERDDPANHEDCMKFMSEICKPAGEDGKEGVSAEMNGEEGENGSGKGFCDNFFDKVNKQLKGDSEEEKPKEEEKKEEEPAKEEEAAPAAEPVPTDGIVGRHTHVDGKTAVKNWRAEYGPRMSDTYNSVCSDNLDNQWCHDHGYGRYTWLTGPWPIYLATAVLLGVILVIVLSLSYIR